jgi:hypothetical protein
MPGRESRITSHECWDSGGQAERVDESLVQAVEDPLDAARDAKLVEDSKKIVADDSGSNLLGFALAFLALDSYRSGPKSLPVLLYPLIAAALPLMDFALAILRRVQSGASPLYGDRSHLYDLLRKHGLPARSVALLCYAVTTGMMLAGWFLITTGSRPAYYVGFAALTALFIAAISLGAVRPEGESSTRKEFSPTISSGFAAGCCLRQDPSGRRIREDCSCRAPVALLRRCLLQSIADLDQQFAQLGAFLHIHIHHFEGARLRIRVAHYGLRFHRFLRSIHPQPEDTSGVQALLANGHAAAQGHLGDFNTVVFLQVGGCRRNRVFQPQAWIAPLANRG